VTARLIRYFVLLCVSAILGPATVTLTVSRELASPRGAFTLLALLVVALVWIHELGFVVRQKRTPLGREPTPCGKLTQPPVWWVDVKHRQASRTRSGQRR